MRARLGLRVLGVVCSGLALALAAAFNGCQAFGGHPNGDAATPDAAPDAGYRACLEGGSCVPDPGSMPTDCSIASGVETLPIVTFDDVSMSSNNRNAFNKAEDMYQYNDDTAVPFFSNGMNLCAAGGIADAGTLCGFEPWTQQVDLCRPDNFALHMTGGPFLGWGGGLGISMQKLNGRLGTGDIDKAKALCLPGDGGAPNPVCPPADAEFAVGVAALDVSHYDGVSFWARRGPNSQVGIHVAVGDKHTDDDLNYLAVRHAAQTGVPEPIYCERIKECGCLYQDSCAYNDSLGQSWCRDPYALATMKQCGGIYRDGVPVPAANSTSSGLSSVNGVSTNCLCGAADVCNAVYSAFPNDAPIGADGQPVTTIDPRSGKAVVGDTAFYGRPCTQYAFPDGTGTSFCFDPARDAPPAAGPQRCGDHWITAVNLTPDWKFFRVPFTDLRQQGFAKKAETLDLHSVSVVRFTWEPGYVDYWIDQLSFYKNPG